jgi:protein-S-isoprenylcysteine O-methyltransferase Ste14
LFCWASILLNPSWTSVAFGVLLFLGALARILSEEQLVTQHYPEYVEYSKSTKRMIPHVF